MKGSFTDAHRDKRGWLESAHGGTIFMDEVGEMSLRMQALLLRFLETGEIQRVGSDRKLPPLDVRVITATHRRLVDHIADKTFREDLYYRLNVMHIEVPPLRDRREDIPVLLQSLPADVLRNAPDARARSSAPEALSALADYHWPGNVRELRNVAERLVLRARDGGIDVDDAARWRSPATGGRAMTTLTVASAPAVTPHHSVLFDRMFTDGASFWSEVYEPFMARDLTRHEVREVVRLGLEHTRGNYKMLVQLLQHAAGGLQEVPELPAQVPVPRAVPAIPHDAGIARPHVPRRHRLSRLGPAPFGLWPGLRAVSRGLCRGGFSGLV